MAEGDHGHEAVYNASALAWDKERSGAFPERFLIERIVAEVGCGAAVLDLGCGSGAPIAAFLAESGCRVTGIDFSASMLELARKRVPEAEFLQGDMRVLPVDGAFSAIIAWDSLFHLTGKEQLDLLPRLAGRIKPSGWLLFTCGPERGERWGRVAGGPVFHASLAPEEYTDLLQKAGMDVVEFVAEDPRVWGRSWCLARRHMAQT